MNNNDTMEGNIPSFNELIEQSVIQNWDLDALTDFKGQTLQWNHFAAFACLVLAVFFVFLK